jgi:hypothetical protein
MGEAGIINKITKPKPLEFLGSAVFLRVLISELY